MLDALSRSHEFQPVCLMTTFTRGFDRVSMHGVRRELIHAQATSLGLPLREMFITQGANNAEYESVMSAGFRELRVDGITNIAFGDLFLADIRAYRERLVAPLGLTPLFPLWERDTTQLVHEFVRRGFRAKLCCVDTRVLPNSFAGRDLDEQFIRDLPSGVDPCGENGEFHSFVFDAPNFRDEVAIVIGTERRDEPFVFRDLCLVSSADASQKEAATANKNNHLEELLA